MIRKFLKYPKTIALLLGIASTYALPPYHQVWILFLTFGLLITMLNRSTGALRSFALGYWFGFGFFAIGLSWIANALALDLASFGWLIPIALLAAGAFFGLFTAIPAWLTFYFHGIWSKVIIFAVLWTTMEWIRSFIFTGFPWNLLGSVLAFDYRLLQLSAYIGTYGLSLLVCLITTLPAAAFVNPKFKNAAIGVTTSVVLILCIVFFGQYRTRILDDEVKSDIKIRIVQPSIPQNLKWDFGEQENNFSRYIEMSQAPGFESTDIVIWGETASTFPLAIDHAHFYQMLPAVPDDGYLITGSMDYRPEQDNRWIPANAGLIFQHGKGIIDTYTKSHLVPFGEYIPLRRFLPDKLRPITKIITDFKAGKGPKTFNINTIPPFGLLICYEIIFPHHVSDPGARPQWLINLTNDGWYGTGAGPYQHLTAAQLRAVEEGLTIVRAANSGVSAVISRTGKIIANIGLHKRGNLDFYLPKNLDVTTQYSMYGNLYFAICAILLFVLAILISVANRKK